MVLAISNAYETPSLHQSCGGVWILLLLIQDCFAEIGFRDLSNTPRYPVPASRTCSKRC